MKKILPLLVLMLLACGVSFADDSRDIPAFVDGYVQSLETLKPGLLDVYEFIDTHDIWSMKDDPGYVLPPSDIPIFQDSLQNFNKDIVLAIGKIEPYLTSENESIRSTARGVKEICEGFALENEKSINELGAFLAGPAETEGGETGAEEASDEEAVYENLRKTEYEVENRIGSFNSSLYHASEAVAEAVQKMYPPDDPSVTYPEPERTDILTRLEILAGDRVPLTVLEGTHFQNALWPLYEALGGAAIEEPKQESQGKEITVIGGK